ncbi:elongation factor G [Lachnoclostridium edouardi]|uniref:elongation factor G n=1 Tax=Lachnoclostridium edouardi TaxID=1926283 RepID=UPI000C7C0384|nr:TetM/TetW/TetO/TetS family tetracycline resistance ribosomal protection protein [Lachnoclostridium edouardi]
MKITFGILAHVDAGKTTLSEQILYLTNTIRSLGSVNKQNSFLDYNDVERERGITVFSEQASFVLNNNQYCLIDTPGHVDFSTELERVLEALDYAVLLIDGTDGIQGHTETIWGLLREYHVPTFLFINKLDRETADYEKTIGELKDSFSREIMDFTNIFSEISEEIAAAAAETREDILDQFIEGNLCFDEIRDEIIRLIQEENIFPCLGGAAATGQGVEKFLQIFSSLTRTDYDNSLPFAGKVIKIRYDEQKERQTFLKITSGKIHVKEPILDGQKINQIRFYNGEKYIVSQEASAGDIVAVTGLKNSYSGMGLGESGSEQQQVNRIMPTLQAKVLYETDISDKAIVEIFHILEEEDPMLFCQWEASLKQLKIHIMGKIQLEILKAAVLKRFGVEITFAQPQVVYLETISGPVTGHGHFEPLRHYAEVAVRLEPGVLGSGITFSSECHVDTLALNFQNLIKTHVFEKKHRGVLTGSELTDIHIILIWGRAHIKHTEGGDFREALYRAIRQGLMKADSLILEPYYAFTIKIAQEHVGRVMNDITKYSGSFQAPDIKNGLAIISGKGSVASFVNYGEEIASFSGGRGQISFRFAGYHPCHNPDEVIKARDYDPDGDIDNPSCSVFCAKGTSYVVNWYEAENYMHYFR